MLGISRSHSIPTGAWVRCNVYNPLTGQTVDSDDCCKGKTTLDVAKTSIYRLFPKTNKKDIKIELITNKAKAQTSPFGSGAQLQVNVCFPNLKGGGYTEDNFRVTVPVSEPMR